MKILRFFTIRILLCAGLVAALALPPQAAADSTTKKTDRTVAHKTPAKNNVKKTVKKTVKKASKSASKAVKPGKPGKPVSRPVARPVVSEGEYVSAGKDGVNVRANPSTEAELSWEIFAGYPLQVKKRQGEWLQVTDFEGDSGWIHESLVKVDKSVIVSKKRINLRQDPDSDKNNPVVAVVRYGVVFIPVEKKDDWLKVRYVDGTEGWLNKDLVWPPDPLD